MQLRQRFRFLLGVQFVLALGLALLTAALFRNQRALSRAQETHFQSYLLADELRQSSDDLTRLARTFVVTGDADYGRQYEAVLDIRNGRAPRPMDYHRIYWDLVTKDAPKPRPDGAAISLHELMIREGFTAGELALLTSAQKYSDALVQTERMAMNAAKGLFPDGAGNFTVMGAPDRPRAIALLHDDAYRENKARVMRPIDDFYVMFAARTAGEVDKFERRSVALLSVMGATIAAILGLFVYSFLSLRRQMLDRERAEAALAQLNVDLEQRVALRTAELAARHHETQALLDSIPDTVWLLDEHGAVISAHSPADRAASADAADQLILRSDDEMLLGIAREIHGLARSTRQTVVQDFDRTLHGATISFEARATPAGADRFLVLLRDISMRKRIEREIVENLERQKQLAEMKAQFMTVASHEFRTPLATAVGSVELLERHAGKLTEAKRSELLTRIQQALTRLTTIMDDMLMLSRADSGRMKVSRMDVDLGRFVTDVIRSVETNDRQQHAFSFQAIGPSSLVPADTNLLHHILSNLLENAVRYSPAGSPVAVVLEVNEQAFAVTITDDGIGIPAAERERIFEPFVRGSNVGAIGGTGLGLNLAKRYIELMGGWIELLPTARGAAFRISVPLQQPPA